MRRFPIHSLSRFSRARYSTRSAPQWINECPEPMCSCQPTPAGLDIDHDSKMTFGPYREHILVCTGQDDWASKIEYDTTAGPVTRHIKTLLGPPGKRGQARSGGITPGKYHNPYSPHMITNASFASSTLNDASVSSTAPRLLNDDVPTGPTSVYLFPSFKYVTLPSFTDAASYNSSLDNLIQNFVNKSSLETSPIKEEEEIIRQQLEGYQRNGTDLNSEPVNEVVVLICGHGGRDSRCGILGLPLQTEFEQKLRKASIEVLPQQRSIGYKGTARAAHVGLTSHIGGHKWAGNIIIYIPPTWQQATGHTLSGTALWYGRVEPKHVEGIVQETIISGRLIKDLWRGGMRLSKGESGSRWEPIAASTS